METNTSGIPYNPAAVAITGGTIDGTPIGATTPSTIAVTKGTAGSPSVKVGNTSGVFEEVTDGRLGISSGGTEIAAFLPGSSLDIFGASAAVRFGASAGSLDTVFTRDGAANILAAKNGNSAQELRVYAGNGGFLSNVKAVTESLTIAAAATTVSATTIPAGAILLGVSVRVTTVIPTAATFTMTTTTGGTTLHTAAVSTAANSTDPGTAAGASYRAASTTVTITPNLTPGTATGVVRLQFYYLQITPATS